MNILNAAVTDDDIVCKRKALTAHVHLCDLLPQVDDAEPVSEAREVLQLSTALL